jgi:hypothetical protein
LQTTQDNIKCIKKSSSKKRSRAGGAAEVVERLASKCKALAPPKQKNEKEKEHHVFN